MVHYDGFQKDKYRDDQEIREFAKSKELSVIIARATCRLLMKRIIRSRGSKFPTFEVAPGRDRDCLDLVKEIACPAIVKKGKKVVIREDLCWGCSLCAQVAKPGAIIPRRKKK